MVMCEISNASECLGLLDQDVLDDFSMDVRESEIAALESIGKPRVVEA